MSAKSVVTRVASVASVTLAALAALGCGTPPPASQVPTARAALDRLHASQDCGGGLHASAKVDNFAKEGRVRVDLLMFAFWPARIRMDVVGPMNSGIVATLASDGTRFSLLDQRAKKFLYGPAQACNIARLTTVPLPGHVLVSLFRGEAPVLKHEEAAATASWSGHGYYVLKIPGKNDTEEEIHIAPHPDDFARPWSEQRMRLLDVVVKQQGVVLYHAELDDHEPAAMATAQIDPDRIDPPIPPSGPMCTAELPRTIHVEVPGKGEDVQFRYEDITWNPPIPPGLFTQPVPEGVEVVHVSCDE